MRVITGSARGRTLKALEGDSVRPTSEKVKEAVFSIIQFEIEGRRVLDLFAGSGQMGIEALSRGAAACVFVDSGKDAVKIIKHNLEHTGLGGNASVMQTDVFSFLRTSRQTFDIVFLDPPYAQGYIPKVLPPAAESVNEGGVIICEAPFGEELPETAGDMGLYRSYKYGKTSITVYRRQPV